jgi:hypothetical protein
MRPIRRADFGVLHEQNFTRLILGLNLLTHACSRSLLLNPRDYLSQYLYNTVLPKRQKEGCLLLPRQPYRREKHPSIR